MKGTNRLKPSLIVCGHFHGNVRFTDPKGLAYGAPLEVVTSGAVGAQMRWDNRPGVYTPAQAAAVGIEKTGFDAFFKHIVDGDFKNGGNIPQRLQANPERSGGRVFEFSDKGYRHRWVTLGEMSDGETLSDFFKLPPGATDTGYPDGPTLVEWPKPDEA